MTGDVFGQNIGIIYSGGILNKVLDQINVESANITLRDRALLGISKLIFCGNLPQIKRGNHDKLLSVWPV